MKNLLNITVFASAVLSIFSSSLTLYEVPILKEITSSMEKENQGEENHLSTNIKKIYISHQISEPKYKKKSASLQAKNNKDSSKANYRDFNVFGVKIASNNNSSKI